MNDFHQDFNEDLNAELSGEQPGQPVLASRWVRLGAAIIDFILLALVVAPILIFAGRVDFAAIENSGSGDIFNQPISYMDAFINGLISLLCYLAINAYFIFTSQQTIGKYILDIQVVADSGEPITGHHYIFVRYLPIYFIGLIPFIGGLISLGNVLLIFRSSRKCLHDDIAKTIVIKKPATDPIPDPRDE